MYVEVELVTDTREDALLVPKRAVIYDQNQAFLYRLKGDSTAERLRVEVLLEDRENVMPSVESGLAVGDRIVVAGQAGLKDGAKVRLASQRALSESDAGASEADDQPGGEPEDEDGAS
jgi:membrane fusion protein (multidrug efflux system)